MRFCSVSTVKISASARGWVTVRCTSWNIVSRSCFEADPDSVSSISPIDALTRATFPVSFLRRSMAFHFPRPLVPEPRVLRSLLGDPL